MALKEIKIIPDPVLREKAARIDKITDKIVKLSMTWWKLCGSLVGRALPLTRWGWR